MFEPGPNTVRVLAAVLVLALVLGAVLWWTNGASTPPPPTTPGAKTELPYAPPPPTPAGPGDAQNVAGPPGRRIVLRYLTRCGGTPYQALTYYESAALPAAQVPGVAEIAALLAAEGQPLPPTFVRVDRESELLADNLGQVSRTLISSQAYVNPQDGRVLAFDIAMTEGGLPQRLVGHRSKAGVVIETYRGAEKGDQNEIQFPPGTEILPVTMDFVHHYFQRYRDRKEFACTFFVPEMMGFAYLRARPLGTELLALGGQNQECARYELRLGSTRAQEGVYALQQMWFDVKQATLARRLDLEAGGVAGDEQVTERVEPEATRTLQPLVVRPTVLPEQAFPYPLDQELVYQVRSEDRDLGKVRIRFARQAANAALPAGYLARAQVDLEVPGAARPSRRREEAVTRYDEHFLPLSYTASGEESVEAQAEYSIAATFQGGQVRLKVHRQVNPLPAGGSAEPLLGSGRSADPGGGAPRPAAPQEGPPVVPVKAPTAWQEPLRPVPFSEEKPAPAAAPKPTLKNEEFERPLSSGTFVFDFHRLEDLAVVAYRFPRPLPPAAPGKEGPPLTQKVAFYSVRQNQAALVGFTIAREAQPSADEDLDAAATPDEKLPALFVASTTHPLMPCRMLLGPDGRLLEFVSYYGTHEVIYTLSDPLMEQRAERLRRLPGQEGPLLFRPPWY